MSTWEAIASVVICVGSAIMHLRVYGQRGDGRQDYTTHKEREL